MTPSLEALETKPKIRACDQCALRRIKCDRRTPCRRCRELGISCTTSRAQAKPGPKGPWAHKRRGRMQEASFLPIQKTPISPPADNIGSSPHQDASSSSVESDGKISINLLRQYLTLYDQTLYPVWPVVDRDEIERRLQDPDDLESYALCTALSAVVIAQLNIDAQKDDLEPFQGATSEALIAESERTRVILHSQQKLSVPFLLSSFFLHIFYANRGHVLKSTLLLREAITFAQFIELDQAKFYTTLSKAESQFHLRVFWLLFITERGHTTRFDLQRLLRLAPDLPTLEAEGTSSCLLPFIGTCNLFKTFGSAMDTHELDRTPQFFSDMDLHLKEIQQQLPQAISGLQRADFLITREWMRLVLWKTAMFHVKLSENPEDDSLSVTFPERAARNTVAHLDQFSKNIVEAHGLGMAYPRLTASVKQMKLGDIAISLADVLLCVPSFFESYQIMQVGRRDILNHLASFLMSIRGTVNPRLQVLQEKMVEYTLSRQPTYLPWSSDATDECKEPLQQAESP
ncbi:hypothetical protein BGZ63DRAFT_406350 [Mariannaea sp. PMI_226]|nr:hypothetical protein BGZ63DRAFT_406350 [Mariannaea sp. PMI_226]